jgi:hypothetical protein
MRVKCGLLGTTAYSDSRRSSGEKLRAEVETFLGPGVYVAVEAVDHIPLEALGKRLLVKRIGG